MKNKMSKKKKIILFSILGVFVIALSFGINYYIRFLNYERDVAAIEIEDIDLNTIVDGEYTGECDVDFIYAKVQVVVKDHTMIELKLLEYKFDKLAGYGAPAVAITDIIMQEQNVKVDAVTGATSSSNTIMKAVENALIGETT